MNMPERKKYDAGIASLFEINCCDVYNQALADVQALNKGTVCVSEDKLRKYLSKARVLKGIKEVPENYINEIITYLTSKGEE